MVLLLVTSTFGLIALIGLIYFKYQDYKARQQKLWCELALFNYELRITNHANS
jgi:hypothetical protein